MFELCGFPFATEKRQCPQSKGDLVGAVHQLICLRFGELIQLWIRKRLACKIADLSSTARQTGILRPGQASKLYGCDTFLDQAVFERVSRAGLNAIKERPHSVGGAGLS